MTCWADSGGRADQIQAFSWAFSELSTVDETQYVDDIFQKYPGAPNFVEGDDQWGLKRFDRNLPARDEPWVAPYEALIRETMERAREMGIRVLMTGQGGDEVNFVPGGYLLWLLKRIKLRRLGSELGALTPERRLIALKRLAGGLIPDLIKDIRMAGRGGVSAPWIDERFARRVALEELEKNAAPPKRYRAPWAQSKFEFVERRGNSSWVLWANQVAHQHGIEMRHPFLDRRLVEFMLRLPPAQKLFKGATKAVLRRAMRGILPESIRLRSGKANFLPLFDGGWQKEAGRLPKDARALNLARHARV